MLRDGWGRLSACKMFRYSITMLLARPKKTERERERERDRIVQGPRGLRKYSWIPRDSTLGLLRGLKGDVAAEGLGGNHLHS